jgi:hypothetical protein
VLVLVGSRGRQHITTMSSFMQAVKERLANYRNVAFIDYIKQRTPLQEIVRLKKLAVAMDKEDPRNTREKDNVVLSKKE